MWKSFIRDEYRDDFFNNSAVEITYVEVMKGANWRRYAKRKQSRNHLWKDCDISFVNVKNDILLKSLNDYFNLKIVNYYNYVTFPRFNIIFDIRLQTSGCLHGGLTEMYETSLPDDGFILCWLYSYINKHCVCRTDCILYIRLLATVSISQKDAARKKVSSESSSEILTETEACSIKIASKC